ncbi:MAG TPA: class I SAM-dependent methyltransferase [Ferruginibacter sp.]|jgi:SAM-dependent methyltransferase|nr:class I SAM-dependent methyltransferase [Ferruginibacter sp.]
MKDNFSSRASVYAQYRPGYPEELFSFIMDFVKEKELAWDCATGNGQCARSLSKYFTKVFATDISQKQLDNAYQAPNIEYALEPAEKTSLADNSVNLVTVAQALHWFNFDPFYSEVKRVAKPGAVIAVWMYSLLQISEAIDAVISEYHYETLKDHWDPERKYVDENYAGIPFPFTGLKSKPFQIRVNWSLEELHGYLNSWSAVQKYMAANACDPVSAVMEKIKMHWGYGGKRDIIFPIHLKLGIIA